MRKGTEGREPGIWVLVYLQPAGLSPRMAGPTVHLYVLHLLEEPAGAPFEQAVWPVLASGLQEYAWVISVHHHSSWHLCLGWLSWAVSPKGQLNCVLQM